MVSKFQGEESEMAAAQIDRGIFYLEALKP
jgi:hypothetical protein